MRTRRLVVGALLLIALSGMAMMQGPASAQIQAALRAFVASPQTITAVWTFTVPPVGAGTPGGSDTQVQFNDGGSAFGGDAGLTYNETTNALTLGASGAGHPTTISSGALGGAGFIITTGVATGVQHFIRDVLPGNGLDIQFENTSAAAGSYTFFAVNAATRSIGFDVSGDGSYQSNLYFGPNGFTLASDEDGAAIFTGGGAGADENLIFNFDDVTDAVGVSSSTGVLKLDFGTLILEGKHNSSDGTVGLTQTCVAAVTAVTIKDGLITAVTCA